MGVMVAFISNVLFNFIVGLLVAKFLGPEEYGRFALAVATAMAIQTAFFDWLRLGATRFYSEKVRAQDPALRATLDVGFALIAVGLSIGVSLLLFTGVRFTLSHVLIGLAMGAAIANGLFDYNTALVRARFHDRLYTRLIIVKNILALTLTGGGAFWFRSAEMTLLGSILSLSGSVITARASLSDPGAAPQLARRGVARGLLRYGLPIVCANLLYLMIPLVNRSLSAVFYGFSETGQFSLAYDMGAKAVQAIGSTLDVVLFQIAVAAHEHHGPAHAKRQLADNIAIVVAIVLPSCTGIWLILPSVEQIIVPAQYRGPFSHLLTLMLAGMFAFAMILYGINPIFQIAKRTAPLIGAAVVACVIDAVLIIVLPRGDDASTLAIAQTGGFIGAFVTLTIIAALTRPQWPRWRDIGGAVLGTAAMAAILLPLREAPPGLATLVLQITAGVVIYTFFVVTLDIAGLRTLFVARVRPFATRFRPS